MLDMSVRRCGFMVGVFVLGSCGRVEAPAETPGGSGADADVSQEGGAEAGGAEGGAGADANLDAAMSNDADGALIFGADASNGADAGGWLAPGLVTGNEEVAEAPQIALDGADNAVVVWQHDGDVVGKWRPKGSAAWGPTQVVDHFESASTDKPALGMLPNGYAVALWTRSYAGLWASRGTSAQWEKPVPLASGLEFGPTIAVSASGSVVAVWMENKDLPSVKSVNLVYASVMSPEGVWSPETRIDKGEAHVMSPRVAVDDKGNAVAAWVQFGQLWANRYENGAWGEASIIGGVDAGNLSSANVAMNGSGQGVVTWIAPGQVLRLLRFEAPFAAGPVEDVTPITDFLSSPPPVVAIDAQANVIVAWQEWDASSHLQARARRRSRASGWEVVEIFETNNETGTDFTDIGINVDPHLAMSSSGNAAVVWLKELGTHHGVWVKRYAPGSGWTGADLLAERDQSWIFDPSAAVSPGGTACVVFCYAEVRSLWASCAAPLP
jgi:hypothetical protein